MIATPASTRALTNLSGHPDWPSFVAWIESNREQQLENLLRSANPVHVHQLQGYVNALGDILQAARLAQPALGPVTGQ